MDADRGVEQKEIIAWLESRGVKVQQPSLSRWLKANRGSGKSQPAPVLAREVSTALTPEVVERSGSLAEIRDRLIALGDDPNATKPQVDALAWAGKIELGRMMVDP